MELLVVISIVALLVALLLPTLGRAKDAARAITCASNQRSVGLLMNMYTADFSQWIPAAMTQYPTSYEPSSRRQWYERLRWAGLIQTAHWGSANSFLNCPTYPASTTSYSYNIYLGYHSGSSLNPPNFTDQFAWWTRTYMVKRPASILWIMDPIRRTSDAARIAHIQWPHPKNHLEGFGLDSHAHPDGMKVLWVDLHLSAVKLDDVDLYFPNPPTPSSRINSNYYFEKAATGVGNWFNQ